MFCPVCKNTQLLISERSGVEIDYCPNCRGVWLDRGELDKIIERSGYQGNQERYQDHKRGDYGRNEYSHKEKPYKKKSNFLGELFDF